MAENPSDLVGKEFIFEYGVDRILPPSEETGGLLPHCEERRGEA